MRIELTLLESLNALVSPDPPPALSEQVSLRNILMMMIMMIVMMIMTMIMKMRMKK